LSGGQRVWILTAAMAAIAAIGFVALGLGSTRILRTEALASPEARLALWLASAVAFYLAEAAVIHLHIGRSAHSFSMSEIPLIFGLFYLSPIELVSARFAGAGLALVISRHQRSVKLAFNLAQFMLSSVAALAILHGVSRMAGTTGAPSVGLDAVDWIAAIGATLGENLVGVLAVAAAITLAEGTSQFRRVPEMLQTGIIVATTNASLALLALTVAADRPDTILLFAVPVATAFFAYRAYIAQRQQHRGLEMLYESTRILQRSPQVDSALLSLLDHVRAMFRADVAEITLLPARASELVLRTSVGPGPAVSAMLPLGSELEDPILLRAVRERRALLITGDGAARAARPGSNAAAADASASSAAMSTSADARTDVGGRTAAALAAPPESSRFRNAMIAPLIGESRMVGTIVVANRLSDISTFDADELTLFETLASHTAIALENGQLEQSLAQLSELKEELHHQAFHDALTGLGNRALFTEEVATRLATPDPAGAVPVVLFLDLDDFKLVNDTMGHAAGDALLRAVGERIRLGLRSVDVAARLGGDEFAILITDHEDRAVATHIANRLIASFEGAYLLGTTSVNVRASIGVAAAKAEDTADDLMRNADVAMYHAKAQGKGRVAVFEPHMAVAVAIRHQLTASLQRAVAAEEFFLNFQPIVEIESGTIVGVESLVRWEDPARGTMWPIEFIPLAEQSDVILRVGRWVLEESCRQAKIWEPSFGATGRPWMSVNISTRQLKQPRFVEEVMEIVSASGLPPTALTLEMTETGMLQDIPDTLAKLRRLREFGLSISVDDFGTGYSSLSYLQRFPVTSLKIARDFVHVDDADPDSWELASAIISMGRALHVDVVAEGVEHLYQLNRLRDLGCQFAQGYYLARPMRAERFEAMLAGPGATPPRIWVGARPGMIVAPTADDDGLTAARSG
jgi:diguanylate cyclase (GGDEF)-like protein